MRVPFLPSLSKEDFTYKGVDFKWSYSNTAGGWRLTFQAGQTKVGLSKAYTSAPFPEFLWSMSRAAVSVWVDDHVIASYDETARITPEKLRAAIELGLKAWVYQANLEKEEEQDSIQTALSKL